ncbi:unnamed protein product [Ectocarpus sp. 6 AP-2014]
MQSLARATGRAAEHAGCLRPRNVASLSRRGAAVALKAATAAAAAGDMPLTTQAGRFLGGLASKVDKVLAEIPMKEAVRYKKGNLKWTRSDVKSHSEALACGLLELGCKAGDTMAMWLPECSEKHVAQLAAARIGMVVAEVDPKLAAAAAVEKILEESGAAVVLVEESVVPSLIEAVPELRHYSTDSGLPFRSAKLPSLRLCIHTGLEREAALLHFRSALLYTPPVSPLAQVNGQIKESAPLHTIFSEGTGGTPEKGKTLSHAEVVRLASWPTIAAILKKEYVEV